MIRPVPRVLHVLSQRPSLTGSGITLDAVVRHAAASGWDQNVVVAVPANSLQPEVGGLSQDHIHPLEFGSEELDYPVPGMSDTMPYESTRFSQMDSDRIDGYLRAWRRHLHQLVSTTRPDVIHSHHLWLVSSILKDVAGETPIVTTCHSTGLRQMELCPHLAPTVRSGCARIDRFAVLHRSHARQLCQVLGVSPSHVRVVGAGFRDDLFHSRGRTDPVPPRLLYVGKFAAAKGVPCLLDAVEQLAARGIHRELHVAGAGSGSEAQALLRRMESLGRLVVVHGQLAQDQLAELMRRSSVCVLPSFYEGLPLVLVEAFASGCRLVATDLPGIVEQLSPHLGDAMETVKLPAMEAVDRPLPDELPAFTSRLAAAIERALVAPPIGDPSVTRPGAVEAFNWNAVFRRVESVWNDLLAH